jgi:pyocin large subunit-like protein
MAEKDDWGTVEVPNTEDKVEYEIEEKEEVVAKPEAKADRESKKEITAMNNLGKLKVEELKDDKDIENTKLNTLSRMAVEEMKKGED